MHYRFSFMRLIWLTTPSLLAIFLYGFVITLPFYLDDSPNFWFTENSDGFNHWAGSEAFRFYRPFVFSLWKAGNIVAGTYDAIAMHALNLFAFAITASLIVALLMQITRWLGWQSTQRRIATGA